MLSFDGAVKLLDFGIAKALAEANENRTETGTLKGKFGYMSPEQVEGKEIDHRTDLFAAGIVLHEVLTGRRLFKGSSDMQTIAMVRDAKVEPPSLLNPAVPPELDRDLPEGAGAACPTIAGAAATRWRRRSTRSCTSSSGGRSGWRRCSATCFPTSRRHSSVVDMASLAETAVPRRT